MPRDGIFVAIDKEDMKSHILLVDQDQTTLDSLKRRLCCKGRAVFTTTSAEAALNIAKKTNIHLAVIDMELFDTPGIELIPILKGLHPDIRVIFTTSDHSIEIESKVRKMGIVLYMPKPLDLGLMKEAVAKGLKDARRESR